MRSTKRKKTQIDEQMGLARKTVATGMMLGVGAGALGSVGAATGAPASVMGPSMAGMSMLGTANLARAGMGLAKMTAGMVPKRKKR